MDYLSKMTPINDKSEFIKLTFKFFIIAIPTAFVIELILMLVGLQDQVIKIYRYIIILVIFILYLIYLQKKDYFKKYFK